MIEPYPVLEFRDGDRAVPFHVAAMLEGVETWQYTYEEALRVANGQFVRDRLNSVQADVTNGHFKDHR